MADNIENLITEGAIKERVSELADALKEEYKDKIRCIVVMTGAMVFFSDLMRELYKRDMKVYFTPTKISSYIGMQSSGEVHFDLEPSADFIIENKPIVVVEDIIDTGYTAKFLTDYLVSMRGAADVKFCTLLDKPSRRSEQCKEIKPDFCGFSIEDKFVVGYGLDKDQCFRELPFIGVYKGN